MARNAPAPSAVQPWTGPREVISVGAYDRTKVNVLVPGQMTVQVSPYLRPYAREITLDPNPDGGDVYALGWRKAGQQWLPTELGIAAVGLANLAGTAGILDVPQASGRADDGRDPEVCTYRATMAMRLPDGQWRVVTREATLKLATLAKEIRAQKEKKGREATDRQGNAKPWPPERVEEEIARELLLKERFLERLTETSAKNRTIRHLLGIKGKYTPEEIRRPFVVAGVVPDMSSPEMQERALEQATSATAALFGPAPSQVTGPARLLSPGPSSEEVAGADVASSEVTADEVAGQLTLDASQHPPRSADTGGGVEPDWFDAGVSTATEAPASGLITDLQGRRREAASVNHGQVFGASEDQRAQLRAKLQPVGIAITSAILWAAFELGQLPAISDVEATAVLGAIDADTDYVTTWRRVAGALADREADG